MAKEKAEDDRDKGAGSAKRGPAPDQRQGVERDAPREKREETQRGGPRGDERHEGLDSKGEPRRSTKPAGDERPRTPETDAPRVERGHGERDKQQRKEQGR